MLFNLNYGSTVELQYKGLEQGGGVIASYSDLHLSIYITVSALVKKIQIINILARSAKYCDNRHMLLFQVLLVAEREENDVTKKAHANSQERNEELNRKVQDADEMIKQLNDIVKRFAVVFNCLSFSILYLVDCTEGFLLHRAG